MVNNLHHQMGGFPNVCRLCIDPGFRNKHRTKIGMPGSQVGTQAFATQDHSRPGYSRGLVCPCTTNYDIPKLTGPSSISKQKTYRQASEKSLHATIKWKESSDGQFCSVMPLERPKKSHLSCHARRNFPRTACVHAVRYRYLPFIVINSYQMVTHSCFTPRAWKNETLYQNPKKF